MRFYNSKDRISGEFAERNNGNRRKSAHFKSWSLIGGLLGVLLQGDKPAKKS